MQDDTETPPPGDTAAPDTQLDAAVAVIAEVVGDVKAAKSRKKVSKAVKAAKKASKPVAKKSTKKAAGKAARGSQTAGKGSVKYGAKVAAARKKKGWSQRVLAESVGMHQSAVCEVEKGRRGVSDETKHRIAKVLGVR